MMGRSTDNGIAYGHFEFLPVGYSRGNYFWGDSNTLYMLKKACQDATFCFC